MSEANNVLESDEDLIIRENERYRDWPPMSGQMPIRFNNGFVLKSICYDCTTCKSTNDESNIRGVIHEVICGDFRVTAYGMCEKCNVLTPILFHLRQKDDGTMFFTKIARKDHIPEKGATIIPFGKKRKRKGKKDGQEGKE